MIELFSILGKGTLFLFAVSMVLTIAYLLVMEWEDWD